MRPIASSALLVVLLAGAGAVALSQEGGDCGRRWSLQGFRLGMTLEEAADLARSRGGRWAPAPGTAGRDETVYSWCGRERDGGACAERDKFRITVAVEEGGANREPREVVVAVRLNVPPETAGYDELEKALVARWGPPQSNGEFVDPESDATLGVFGRRARWVDRECDVRATLQTTHIRSFWERNRIVETSILVERLSRAERADAEREEAARSLVAP
ncbi:MAG: hypothetical protein D6718_04895 [Acidobacteria bacterium]|nr:MAG: hypothetical protein D6718_04895 [Acidobacteriota bacterium]